MAGSPGEEWYLHIQPTTLTDLTVTYDVGSAGSSVTSYTKTLSNFSISNGYLVCKLSTDNYPQNTVISSTGYVTAEQTNNWFGFGNDDYYVTLKPEHLYAWKCMNDGVTPNIIYTDIDTSELSDNQYLINNLYNSDGASFGVSNIRLASQHGEDPTYISSTNSIRVRLSLAGSVINV